MKVVGISAGRKFGNSEILLREALAEVADRTGAEVGILRVGDLNIKPCTGCVTCTEKGGPGGDPEFRCVTPRDADDTYFVEQQLRAADGIIVSTPAYNLMPPGILISLINKAHAFGDYRIQLFSKKKVGAAITCGGTDWTNYVQPLATMAVMDLVGGYDVIADSMLVQFVPSVGMVSVDEDALTRARLLGERVAKALQGETIEKVNDGTCCPVCQGTLFELRDGKPVCPNCEMIGEAMLDDGKVTVHFSNDSIKNNRWDILGQKLHFSNIVKMNQKAMAQRAQIEEKRRSCHREIPYIRPNQD